MAYDVLSLIDDDKPDVISVMRSDLISDAINLMKRNNYSQLPVVDDMDKLEGMVTFESIVTAIRSINTTPGELKVLDAKIPVENIQPDDEITKCLDILKRDNVSIIEDDGKILQIVTTYDALEFFQKKAQDMLWVEDIESSIKDLIENATFRSDGESDQEFLDSLIERVTKTGEEQIGRIRNLLIAYLGKKLEEEISLDHQLFNKLVDEYLPTPEPRSFDELSFFDYAQLLLLDEIWKHYQDSFSQSKDKLADMLDRVRDSRNFLAHFKGELPKEERDHLRFMKDWFANQEVPESIYLPVGDVAKEVVHQIHEDPEEYDWEEKFQPTDEVSDRKYSKYGPLAVYLYSQSGKFKRLELTFTEIEKIIGDELPLSAREHTAWWANDSVGHSHSIQWLNAGWRVSYKNLKEGKVTFVRIKEREKAYINFYNNLHMQLLATEKIPMKQSSPNGANWYTIAKVPEVGKRQAAFGFAFTWEKQFRVELYIDTGDKDKNKAIFDGIYDELKYTKVNEEEITWEEIPEKKASRIAIYREGSIDLDTESLFSLRNWAGNTMNEFYEMFNPVANKVIEDV